MGQLTRDCPHCNTKRSAFSSFGEVCKPNSKIYVTSFYCHGCHGGYVAEIQTGVSPSAHGFQGDIETAKQHYMIHKEYPLPMKLDSPQYLPENLNKFYYQAKSSLKEKNFDASAMMSRKVLEVATKILAPDFKGNLYNRIEQLGGNGAITTNLKEWAHIIRDDGNEAAHEEEPVSPEFAEELLSFAEMFLMYTFTMPGMVASKRSKDEPDDA